MDACTVGCSTSESEDEAVQTDTSQDEGAQTDTIADAGLRADVVVEQYIELHNDEAIITISKRQRLRTFFSEQVRSGHWALQCLCIVLSTFLTHCYANHGPKVGGNLAQATVVTLGCQVVPPLGAPVAMGAYLGAGSQAVVPHYLWVGMLSLLGCAAWRLVSSCKLLVGFGGRIGLTAFCTCHALQLVLAMPLGAVEWNAYGDPRDLWDPDLPLEEVLIGVTSPVPAVLLSKALRDSGGSFENPVAGATAAALACFVPLSVSGWRYADGAMPGVGIGSFVGMASFELLPRTLDFGAAALFAGGFHVLLGPVFKGWAGKQGFCAFLGFSLQLGLRRLGLAALRRAGRKASSHHSSQEPVVAASAAV